MMDSFTAGLLVGMAKDGLGTDLYKQIVNDRKTVPATSLEWFEANVGKRVKIKHTSYHGIVHKFNSSECGLYSGDRYPIYVKLDSTCVFEGESLEGKVYEYAIDQLEIVE